MINLETNTIKRGDMEEPIKEWAVWFGTPNGLCSTLEEAQNICLANDWLPNLMIIPVVIAVGETTFEPSYKGN